MCKKLVFLVIFATSPVSAYVYGYHDATAENTYMAADYSPLVTESIESADGIWRLRPGFGMAPTATMIPATPTTEIDTSVAGTVLESTGWSSPSDDVPRLVTIVTGLSAAETYDVYVCFWGDASASPWRIRAGLTNDAELPLWVVANGIGGAGPSGPTPPIQIGLDMSNRVLWAALVGTVSGVEYVEVFVEDQPAVSGVERTWYDGVFIGIPEPSSITLLALSGLILRRRK